jgi:hypothetical protein
MTMTNVDRLSDEQIEAAEALFEKMKLNMYVTQGGQICWDNAREVQRINKMYERTPPSARPLLAKQPITFLHFLNHMYNSRRMVKVISPLSLEVQF